MNWNKAGRPPKHVTVNVNVYTDSHEADEEWTKEELTLIRRGPEALIRAVVKQWKEDGAPEDPGILPWLDLLNQIEQKNLHNKTEYSIGKQDG